MRIILAAFTFLLPLAVSCASLVAPEVSTAPAALKPGAYALDKKHASLIFKAGHMGFSHYVGRFETFDATLDFDAADPAAARVEAVIDIASLDIGNDDFATTLTGASWFNAGRYPQAVFRSSGVVVTGASRGFMSGDLSLAGVTLPVTLDVAFNGGGRDILRGGYVIGFSAAGTISRKAFGVGRFPEFVADEVAIEIEAEFVKR